MPTFLLIAAALQLPADDRLAAVLDSARQAMHAPGAVAAVIFPDGRHWSAATGYAATGRLAERATVFELGSITKSYVAAAVVVLAGQGYLALDAPVVHYLPAAPVPRAVTVRQLLNHTSGLASPQDNPAWLPRVLAEPARTWSPDETLSLLGEPRFAPGAGWSYSNGGYLVLGQLVEAVAQAPVHAVLHRVVLEPLGLGETYFLAADDPPPDMAHAFIDFNGDGVADDLGAFLPMTAFRSSAWTAGAMAASAADAARFMRALHHERFMGASYDEMAQLVDRPDGQRYGLGVLVIGDLVGHAAWGHKGNSAGFSAAAFHLPGPGVTVAVLTNAHQVDVTPMAAALLRAAGVGVH